MGSLGLVRRMHGAPLCYASRTVELVLEDAALKQRVHGVERLEERRLLSLNFSGLLSGPFSVHTADFGAGTACGEYWQRGNTQNGISDTAARSEVVPSMESPQWSPESPAREIDAFLTALQNDFEASVPGTFAEGARYDYDRDADVDFDDMGDLLDGLGLHLPIVGVAANQAGDPPAAPYPDSPVIAAINFDFASHDRRAPGSDNWPITWAADGHQYAAWGDGGGFGGTNSDGRDSLGVARIEGDADNYQGINVWGGKNGENPAQFNGKSYGILSVAGDLYMWVSPGSGTTSFTEARLAVSHDLGATWALADWAFNKSQDVILPTFLQFGRDYAGARDAFVYSYSARLHDASGLNVQDPGQIDLMRVPSDQILNESAWEFFAGISPQGDPIWVSDPADRQPVFEDPNGVGWTVSVSYNEGLDRYVLATEHTKSARGNLGVFDAPEPWGPWSTAGYYTDWGSYGRTFFWNFSNKWLSADGRGFTILFTGKDENDSWNSVSGSFLVAAPMPGDMNFDGQISFDDIEQFVLAIERPSVYVATYGVSGAWNGDHDGDNDLDFDDIEGFVESLGGIFSTGTSPHDSP